MKLSHDEMIKAMRSNDASYDGSFFVCVRTTKIFCLPSCKARLPKLENIIFVATRDEALAAGFRGCKRCRAGSFPHTQPSWLEDVLATLAKRTGRLDEAVLAEVAGVDISTIRRYFKVHLKTTPMAMHRRLRLEHAHGLLQRGEDALTAALQTGFESGSGFRSAYIKNYGHPPGRQNAC